MQALGRGERARNHQREGENGRVLAGTDDARRAERVDDLAVGDLALGRVERLVLEEDHRIGVAHRRGEQPDHVARVGRRHDLEAGDAIAQFSTLWLCWAPKREPAPLAVRTTSGQASWPLLM